jgi:hypothetical protein
MAMSALLRITLAMARWRPQGVLHQLAPRPPTNSDQGMTAMNLPPVSPLINVAFNVARAKYRAEHAAWTNLSYVLSGRFNLPVAMMNIQRQGDLDLLLRCMEDEFEANRAAEIADTTGSDMTFHHQLTLSETWVVDCYEILRAFRQRDRDALKAGVRPSGVSEMKSFKSIFADLELLRMPMTKFEIAKDDRLKEPLPMQRRPANANASDQTFYDSKDPARYHLILPQIEFPRRVSYGEVGVTYRFDEGAVVPRMTPVSPDGTSLWLWISSGPEISQKIRRSKRLRMQMERTFIDFDLTGADAAIAPIHCK